MRLRYIDEINSFHDWLVSNSISPAARILWFALMHYCNRVGWKREFNVAISALELDTGLSRQSIFRARNILQQSGRIIVKSRKGNQSANYIIIPFASRTDTQSNTQKETQGTAYHIGTQNDTHANTQGNTHANTQGNTQGNTQTDTIHKTKTKTKTRLDNIYSRVDEQPDDECRDMVLVEQQTKPAEREEQSLTEKVDTIVGYLNEKAGTRYKASTPKTVALIKTRLKEGFTVEDFRTVIDKKVADWIGDDSMVKYLRPETLFGTKFEGYLNEQPPDLSRLKPKMTWQDKQIIADMNRGRESDERNSGAYFDKFAKFLSE